MTNDSRFVVLPTKGNIGTGTQKPWDLAPNQIGFFDAVTNDAILFSTVGTNPADVKALADKDGFYIAIGVDKDSDGTVDDIKRSFRTIYPNKYKAFTQKCATAFVPKIIEFDGCKITYETSYFINIQLINPELYKETRNTDYEQEFLYHETEKQIDPNQQDPDIALMLHDFEDQMNIKPHLGFIKLEYIDASNAVITDIDTWVSSNPGLFPKMRFTVDKPQLKGEMLPLYYYINPREIDVSIIPTDGFESNGTVTVTQQMVYEETSGRDIQELERVDGGWTGNPGQYRELNAGLKEITYLSDPSTLYSTISLFYTYRSKAGSSIEYENDLQAVIAIPDGDTTTGTQVTETLGALLTGSATGLSATTC